MLKKTLKKVRSLLVASPDLNQMSGDKARCGLTVGKVNGKPYVLDASELKRHVLLSGAYSSIGQLNLQFLLTQQLRLGGGFLYIQEGERMAGHRLAHLVMQHASMDLQRISYVSYSPPNEDGYENGLSRVIHTAIEEETALMIQLGSGLPSVENECSDLHSQAVASAITKFISVNLGASIDDNSIQSIIEPSKRVPKQPFLIIIPSTLAKLMNALVFAQARALGIGFLIQTDEANDMSELILANTFTQLKYEPVGLKEGMPKSNNLKIKKGNQDFLNADIDFHFQFT